ncbi:uncharacterized protein BCR38DRAFT_50063 [Pseudomassariella vexata]|uniref:Uncharacterized protein n=1 Tax=Pseudomassariella vexata TaxID=1141098 RepID=A0A1Y2DP05_9PEZI|nr:uncharacterized protein BCR38DRAFT_50063 [Pseudomassariella vexata]ORY60980.1 hypothetical protein BCR38DRAFT_50063 [Pseudomassariella vexata]
MGGISPSQAYTRHQYRRPPRRLAWHVGQPGGMSCLRQELPGHQHGQFHVYTPQVNPKRMLDHIFDNIAPHIDLSDLATYGPDIPAEIRARLQNLSSHRRDELPTTLPIDFQQDVVYLIGSKSYGIWIALCASDLGSNRAPGFTFSPEDLNPLFMTRLEMARLISGYECALKQIILVVNFRDVTASTATSSRQETITTLRDWKTSGLKLTIGPTKLGPCILRQLQNPQNALSKLC